MVEFFENGIINGVMYGESVVAAVFCGHVSKQRAHENFLFRSGLFCDREFCQAKDGPVSKHGDEMVDWLVHGIEVGAVQPHAMIQARIKEPEGEFAESWFQNLPGLNGRSWAGYIGTYYGDLCGEQLEWVIVALENQMFDLSPRTLAIKEWGWEDFMYWDSLCIASELPSAIDHHVLALGATDGAKQWAKFPPNRAWALKQLGTDFSEE